MAKLAVIDDHPLTRGGVERLFADGPFEVVFSAASAEEFESSSCDADLVILDLYLQNDKPDLDAVRRLSLKHKVLIVSASGRGRDVLEAIRAGARGYITKQASDESLIDAVRFICNDGFYLTSQLADVMHAESERLANQPNDPELSEREKETLRFMAKGFTIDQAATRMGISSHAVNTYLRRVKKKLNIYNRADQTRKAIELGLLDDDVQD